jgi:hypothetical protein
MGAWLTETMLPGKGDTVDTPVPGRRPSHDDMHRPRRPR